jgi:hypothetical protein
MQSQYKSEIGQLEEKLYGHWRLFFISGGGVTRMLSICDPGGLKASGAWSD